MKDAIIAKLANQSADYYGDAFKQCQYKDILPKVCNFLKTACKIYRSIMIWYGYVFDDCQQYSVILILAELWVEESLNFE